MQDTPHEAPPREPGQPIPPQETIRAGRRVVRGRPLPETVARVLAGRADWLERELGLARDLAQIDMHGAFLFEHCASLHEFAARAGYDPERARVLADAGWALAHLEGVEDAVRRGRLSLSAAAALGVLWRRGARPRSGEDWVLAARDRPLRDLRRWVRRRLVEEQHQTEGLVEVTVHLTAGQRGTLDRARVLASREAGQALSNDQTVVRALDFFVDAKDPLKRPAGARRVGPTSERPDSRYVPREVLRQLLERSGDACEVPDCPHDIFLEICHVDPHADGGDQELTNCVRLCRRHHTLLDAGRMRVVGFDEAGHPVFEGCPQPPRRPPPARGGSSSSGSWPDRVRESRGGRRRTS